MFDIRKHAPSWYIFGLLSFGDFFPPSLRREFYHMQNEDYRLKKTKGKSCKVPLFKFAEGFDFGWLNIVKGMNSFLFKFVNCKFQVIFNLCNTSILN